MIVPVKLLGLAGLFVKLRRQLVEESKGACMITRRATFSGEKLLLSDEP